MQSASALGPQCPQKLAAADPVPGLLDAADAAMIAFPGEEARPAASPCWSTDGTRPDHAFARQTSRAFKTFRGMSAIRRILVLLLSG